MTGSGAVADAVTSNQMEKSQVWRMNFGVDQKAEGQQSSRRRSQLNGTARPVLLFLGSEAKGTLV